tara:strand:+ start:12372 stop:12692 length:321 start_codon:yes stop_codon:yes gene_type:complete
MKTDNMRKENEIIVEALTKMRKGAQRRVEDGLHFTGVNTDELSSRSERVWQIDALIARHSPKPPTKNEAVVDKIEALSIKVCWPEKKLSISERRCILQVLNEEYPE